MWEDDHNLKFAVDIFVVKLIAFCCALCVSLVTYYSQYNFYQDAGVNYSVRQRLASRLFSSAKCESTLPVSCLVECSARAIL